MKSLKRPCSGPLLAPVSGFRAAGLARTASVHSWALIEPRGRPGNLIVTSMLIVLGLMVVFAGVNSMLKEQMRQSLDIKDVALGKQQVLYLGEMGINQAMYEANSTGAFPTLPKAYDLKSRVAMLSSDPNAVATCTISNDGGSPPYLVTSTLTYQGTTYTKSLRFNATHRAATASTPDQWLLTNYLQLADSTGAASPTPTSTP